MKENDGQETLFDLYGIDVDGAGEKKLEVIKSSFDKVDRKTWRELFEGYDELYAITFSSGVRFCLDLIGLFTNAEIIFGNELVVTAEMASIIAGQEELIKYVVKSGVAKKYMERINKDSLSLYVAKDVRSHEKIYCLRANDGRTRVVTGSANMSASAFYGMQREVIEYYDDEDAFEYYFNRFCTYKDQCSNKITKETLLRVEADEKYLEENIEEVPVVKEIEKKTAIILEDASEDDRDETEIVTKVKGLESQLKPMLPKPKKEKGKIVINAQLIKKFVKEHKSKVEEKKLKERELPRLHLDYDKERLDFNGKVFNMNPTKEEIKSDVKCLTEYISSLNRFSGKVPDAQKDYYAFFNWYFASIFIPKLRYVAESTNYEPNNYPVFGILYGESNGAKSTFVSLLSKLMTGKKIPINSSDDFTYSNIEKLKRGCEGVPIYIDDLVKTQYTNHAEKIIKDDLWGIADGFVNYPAVVVSTNSVPSVNMALSKRSISKRITIRIDKEEGSKSSKMINDSIQKAKCNLFCEYVRRMLPLMNEMFDKMRMEDAEYFPDIFEVSSGVLYDIISEVLDGELPEYVTHMSYSDYFGDKIIGKNAIEKIKLALETESKLFTVDKKKNRLIYNLPENGANYELRYLKQELPVKLNAQVNQSTLVMDLSEAKKYFGKKFKKSFWGRFS